MTSFLNKNLVFIDTMQFMNSSLDELITKSTYPYEYMNSFKRFNEEKLPARKYFYSSIKEKKIGDDGKTSDGHIGVNDYLTCKKT